MATSMSSSCGSSGGLSSTSFEKQTISCDADTHRKGKTLPEVQNVYRAKVVMTFMKTGVSLSKLDCPDLRNL